MEGDDISFAKIGEAAFDKEEACPHRNSDDDDVGDELGFLAW